MKNLFNDVLATLWHARRSFLGKLKLIKQSAMLNRWTGNSNVACPQNFILIANSNAFCDLNHRPFWD